MLFRLTSECHTFAVSIDGQDRLVAYFPLKSLVLQVNDQAVEILSRMKLGPVSAANGDELEFLSSLEAIKVVNGPPDIVPDAPRPDCPRPIATILLMANKCNLRCEYCYANSGAEGSLMSLDIAKAAVDTVVRNALDTGANYIKVEFHGGGEPTLNWEALTETIEYGRGRCNDHGIHLQSVLCTNGVMPEQRARWVGQNIDIVTVSIDGPPEVQDRQRPMAGGQPSFDRVARTIDILRSLGKNYAFRTTVTADSVHSLPRSFELLASRFRPSTFCVEPLYLCGRCETTRCSRPAAHDFIRAICECMDRSAVLQVPVAYSGGKLNSLDSRFCGTAGNNFAVTAEGDVTSCVEVSCRTDPRSQVFMYGSYDRVAGTFRFDEERYRRLVSLRVQDFGACVDCLARWHCSGDCLAKAPDVDQITHKRNQYRCEINRAVTVHQIGAELSRMQNAAPFPAGLCELARRAQSRGRDDHGEQ
jgi:uncharacterized protein